VKLKWLEIERFRTVKPGTRLVFDDGINVLLGKNGTGKTTLLELISALVTGDIRRYQRETFSISFESETDEVVARFIVRNCIERESSISEIEHDDASWEVDAQLNTPQGDSLRVRADQSGAQVTDSETGVKQTSASSPFARTLYASVNTTLFRTFAHRLSMTKSLRRSGFCPRFDEGLDTFERLFGSTSELTVLRAEKPDTLLLPQEGVFAQGELRPMGGTSDSLVSQAADAPWLDEVKSLFGLDNVVMYVRRTAVRPDRGGDWGRVTEYGRFDFEMTFADGELITHEQLSYGQKRLLTFFFLMHVAKGPLIADELVNGMHHEWIERVIRMISERGGQAFLSSQNPLLLDELEFGDTEAVRRTFILAGLEGRQFVWRKPNKGEARRFFAAYETGIQHVGEVLLTEGLW